MTHEAITRVTDSAFMEECHECDNVTRHMWQTRHCVVRACSFECALAFHKGAGADSCECPQTAHK